MANYNPHSPQNIGMEWVAIRDEDLVLDPFANSLERGYGFTLSSSTQANNVRFYVNEFPPLFVRNQAYTANIYPRGLEADSGPIGRVVIPCNDGSIDSPGGTLVTSPSTVPVEACVYNPSSNYFLNWEVGGANYNTASFFFATNSYSQLLSGKRILGVNLLTGINVTVGQTADPDDFAPTLAGWLYPLLTNDAQYAVSQDDGFVIYRPLTTFQTPTDTRLLVRTRMGDADLPFGNNGALTAGSPNIMQWTYPELQRFESSAGAARLFITLHSSALAGGAVASTVLVLYVALEVFYCEERRVAFGTRNINGLRFVQARDPFQLGMNQIILRTPAGATNPILVPGDYTVTLSEANTGDDFNVAFSPFETAKVNELRQLYEVPTVPGVQVNLPFPLNDEAIGATLTKESTELIPQLSLHASGGAVITTSHSYGRQAVGQVWGTRFVTQDIDDSVVSTQTPYWTIRYYARRFGNTTVPLTACGFAAGAGLFLSGASGTQASTPDNAALDIAGDIDIRVDATLSNAVWFATSSVALLAKYSATGNQRSYRLYIENGLLRFGWSPDGATVNANSPNTAHVPAPGGRLAVRVTMDVDDGAGNRVIRFYTAPTIAGPFTQLGSTITTAGVTSIFNSTSTMFIGADGVGASSMLNGTVHSAEVYSGIAGSVVANPDFAAQPIGTTSFTDGAGRTWTLNGAAQITGGVTLSCCSITPTEFDALDEILDGWKAIECRFTSPAYMGGSTYPVFRWTAAGEAAGSRWEVLGSAAYAASGIAQQMPPNIQLAQVPAGQQLYSSTYGAPSRGATVNEEWMPQLGPYVSGSAEDQSADVSVIFAQDMPTVTGFSVSIASQAVTGIGQDCGIDPCGIPTHVLYNQLSWGLPVNTGIASDNFDRVVASGWGTASDGKVWQNTDASNSVNGTLGLDVVSTGAVRIAWVNVGGPNQNVTATVSMDTVPATLQSRVGVAARITDASNYYSAELQYESTGIVRFLLRKRVAGVGSDLADFIVQSMGMSTTASRKVRIEIVGSLIRGKIWDANIEEPTWWQLEATDTSFTTGNNAGTFARNEITGSPTVTYSYDNFSVTPPTTNFGYYELQRSDSITDWATIMKSTSVATTGFKDYEARIGMSSSYRIRGADAYDFTGPWSSTVSVSTISPGVSGSCLSDAHVMVFTTNERQDGSSNLAYSNVWEGEVEEGFSFAEAGFTQLQPMYDKDFFTAFRPTERGGEQFSRDVLVQAAAISPPTLGDFRSLRDMAWDSVSYICVRDEDGNRWFANVNVPSGVVRNRRRLYIASVQIVEVTDTPAEVDP